MTPARLRGLLLAVTAVLAALVFLAWSQPWFTLDLSAASGDPAPLEVRGDVAAAALAPLALAVLGALPAAGTWVVIVCFAVYAFFSGGPGNLQWLYPNELFPTEIRASAVGAAMGFSRIGTVISTFVLPDFLATYGTRATIIAGTVISMLGLAVSIAMAPETKGLTLSQSSQLGLGGAHGAAVRAASTASDITNEKEPSR